MVSFLGAKIKKRISIYLRNIIYFNLLKRTMIKNDKLCCRIFPIVLILVSTIFALAIWYFDEGVRQFTFLKDWGEFVNFLGTVLFISIIPIGIFYFFVEKEKYQSKAKLLSLLGFLPAVILLLYILL